MLMSTLLIRGEPVFHGSASPISHYSKALRPYRKLSTDASHQDSDLSSSEMWHAAAQIETSGNRKLSGTAELGSGLTDATREPFPTCRSYFEPLCWHPNACDSNHCGTLTRRDHVNLRPDSQRIILRPGPVAVKDVTLFQTPERGNGRPQQKSDATVTHAFAIVPATMSETEWHERRGQPKPALLPPPDDLSAS
jgi:hypothetical protein